MLFARRKQGHETLVINALASCADMTGGEISRAVGLGIGRLYPVLMRLEEHGRITSRWETETPRPEGPPRRRFYALPADELRH